jgi:DNA-binding CsgD family transcriptional regulator
VGVLGEHDTQLDDDLVGSDRDGTRLGDALLGGTSVVIVGTLGSGKSHVIREATRRLVAAGTDPIFVRSGGPLGELPFGALDASGDPRLSAIRDGETPSAPPIIIVDDAHELDDASASVLVRAVYRRAATVLMALTVSRHARAGADGGASHMAVDLWLRGLAARVDLAELVPADAHELLTLFGGEDFDSVTTAAVIGLADGSRMLLRELVREATHAVQQGRDALTAIRDSPVHSRLSDAAAAHVAQLPQEQRLALAVLGRLPLVEHTVVSRLVSAQAIDALIAARLVHDDGTPDRRLAPNWVLARQAEQFAADGAVDEIVAGAARSMLEDDSAWWSVPIARRLATAWQRGDQAMPGPDEASPQARRRVALDSAQAANDDGDSETAAAMARWGAPDGADVDLALEAAYADAARGLPVDVSAVTATLGPDTGCATLLRWLYMSTLIPGGGDETVVESAVRYLDDAACADPAIASEMTLRRANVCVMRGEWPAAVEHCAAVMAMPTSSGSQRMRASVLAGLAESCLGDVTKARQWFVRAERWSGERGAPSAASTRDRLWALGAEIIAHGLTGTDARPTLARLSEEYVAAVLEADPLVLAVAGFVAASAWASVGDAPRAASELYAALRRPAPPLLAGWSASVQVMVARVLALHGRVDEARRLLDAIDPAVVDEVPLGRHARKMAEAVLLAADGDREGAVRATRVAVGVVETAPTILARDLFQLIALGEDDSTLVSRLRDIATDTTVPAARLLSERATALLENPGAGSVPPFEALRTGAVWGIGEVPREWMRRVAPPRAAPVNGGYPRTSARPAENELTRREREIALLVAEGLSNRQIATQLFLSIRTVESHIYQARAKVDAASRGELGRIVAQRERSASGPQGRPAY